MRALVVREEPRPYGPVNLPGRPLGEIPATAYGSGDFFAYPGPRVTLEPPSAEHRRAKEQFERVLATWFTG